MPRTDYHTLINQGRKAGLRTTELYGALAARRPEGNSRPDGNGFVLGYGRNGERVYYPVLKRPHG
jgi:hypothetical protein